MSFTTSENLYQQASQVLPGGVSTGFRRAERPVPLFFESAEGPHLIDVDGNRYVDYVCGYGPVILGHSDPRVREAASAGMALQQVGGQQPAEIELAEGLCSHIPSFEFVRFSLSGSEAVHAAVRLARGVTGRDLVLKFAGHYHGWLDGILTATASREAGPDTRGQVSASLDDIVVIDWNDPAQFQAAMAEHGDRLAAVIMEPMPCNQGVIEPAPGYLEMVRAETRQRGVKLIFDEVITGFRIGLGGVQERFGVTPDLTVIAKAMANGVPISAFGGSAELAPDLADNSVLHAGTFNGGGASLGAALATIEVLAENDGAVYGHMERLGTRLRKGLEEIAGRHGHRLLTQGPGPVFYSWFTERDSINNFEQHQTADFERYAQFAEALLGHGVRVIPTGRWYLTASHRDEDVDLTLEAVDRALAEI